MTLNKEDFKTLLMLYAANNDGNIRSEDVKVMLEKSGLETEKKVEKLFDKMSDMEVIDCIRENKDQHASTEIRHLDPIHDLFAVIEADEKTTMMEKMMLTSMRRVFE